LIDNNRDHELREISGAAGQRREVGGSQQQKTKQTDSHDWLKNKLRFNDPTRAFQPFYDPALIATIHGFWKTARRASCGATSPSSAPRNLDNTSSKTCRQLPHSDKFFHYLPSRVHNFIPAIMLMPARAEKHQAATNT
jgi:hypothetical protein